jgi:hypothetical protein
VWSTDSTAVVAVRAARGQKCLGSVTVALGRAQFGAPFFSNCSKIAQFLQFKYAATPKSKNVQTLHGARVEHSERLFPLGRLPIPNRIHVTNFGTNSAFNSSSNFKGIQTFLKNSDNFLKILFYPDMIYLNMNLY